MLCLKMPLPFDPISSKKAWKIANFQDISKTYCQNKNHRFSLSNFIHRFPYTFKQKHAPHSLGNCFSLVSEYGQNRSPNRPTEILELKIQSRIQFWHIEMESKRAFSIDVFLTIYTFQTPLYLLSLSIIA